MSSPPISGATIGGIIAGVVIVVVVTIVALLICRLKTHSENARPLEIVEPRVGQKIRNIGALLWSGGAQPNAEFEEIPGGRIA